MFAGRFVVPTSCMTGRANRLDVVMVIGVITEIVIVLVASLAWLPDVIAVSAWKFIRVWSLSRANLYVDSLAGLDLISVARLLRCWPWFPSNWVDSKRHCYP